MGVFEVLRPKWKHGDADVRRSAIAEIDDPAVLVEMVIGDGEWFVRHKAFTALRAMKPDETHYRRLMRECGDEEIRRKVVKAMADEAELERVAKEDKYRYIRDAAEHRLNEIRSGIWDDLET